MIQFNYNTSAWHLSKREHTVHNYICCRISKMFTKLRNTKC